MTDADIDGSHIADLLLLGFLKLFPGLVEAGLVYKAVPPLYGVDVGKKIKYFSTRLDYAKYMQDQYYKNNTVCYTNNVKVESSVFASLLLDNSDYIYDMKMISDRKKLDPKLIENVIISHLKNEKIDALKKRLRVSFRNQ